ncbi:TPR-like protein [Hypoxylon trugodes]|uniref:TPR-like protein n=1 Tax=Hypoxylon trugodes TaxID=326681 RepID=UPI002195A32D|nr:TPR-like protein [Hypoxylon trugodes]KAI1393543.1 TPR-like protein [Hypoxylon trugodes]
MAPTNSAVAAQLRQIVHYHLDNISYDNALFFAEKLVAIDPRSTESPYLLALCHFQLGDYKSAYEISKAVGSRGSNVSCSYIFAQCCLALGRYKDGIVALEKSRGAWSRKPSLGKHNATSRAQHPDTASAACLLGKLYRAYDDKRKAILHFEEALKGNPFMWDAFTALCDMGVNVRTTNIFKPNDTLLDSLNADQSSGVLLEQKDSSSTSNYLEPQPKKPSARTTVFDPMGDPFESNKPMAGNETLGSNFLSGENDFVSRINAARSRMVMTAESGSDTMETPTSNHVDSNIPRINYPPEPPQAPTRKPRNAHPIESGLADMPSKMGYRAGTRRTQKLQEKSQDDLLSESNPTLLRPSASTVSGIERKRTVSGQPVQPRQQSEEPGAPQRRSARLNMVKGTGVKTNAGMSTLGATRELKKARPPISRIVRPNSSGSNVGRAVSGNRKPLEENGMDVDHAEAPRIRETYPAPIMKPVEPESVKVEETLKYLLELLKKFGSGYLALSQYRCTDALAFYTALPRAHQDTPWMLSQMGRAYYEQASYAEAEKYYRRLRILAPTRLEDMEVYSTILWFLKRETDLSFLAHELVELSWHSPQAWCALGNAWSLARDHEQALRCFKRATQLNPRFAYAFTLQGHEYVSNEEYEKALTAYRQAVSADRRHYNAYYGIGRVYEKLGSYDKAYIHFHSASAINPTNAVLICCIGNVLEKQRQIVKALQFFSKATELAPQAAQTRYKKARALLALNQYDEAQRELEILKTLAPDEATVHFLLGKLYKGLNDKGSSVRHFTIALNLDPKASQQIKEAIESLEDDDSFDDSMMA